MNKAKVLELIIERLRTDLAVAAQAARETHVRATHTESQARSQYDTFALEASYLAQGQAKRVQELELALGRYQSLVSRDLNGASPIVLPALITLENEAGERRVVFLGPDAGGLSVSCDGTRVVIVTPGAPLGEALLGRTVGDSVEVQIDRAIHELEIVAVV